MLIIQMLLSVNNLKDIPPELCKVHGNLNHWPLQDDSAALNTITYNFVECAFESLVTVDI